MRIPPIMERVEDSYGGQVSSQLRHLLVDVCAQVQRSDTDLPKLFDALEVLLVFSSRSGAHSRELRGNRLVLYEQ
jgi:hypothetical protein